MTKAVDTIVEDTRWNAVDLAKIAETAGDAVFGHLALKTNGYQIALLGCSDQRIAELNRDFRGKPMPTNVLSWPTADRSSENPPKPDISDEPLQLGDIAIAFETCSREAETQEKSLSDHITHLIVHGILHLFGYDHEEDDDAALMEGAETTILASLGIADPYE